MITNSIRSCKKLRLKLVISDSTSYIFWFIKLSALTLFNVFCLMHLKFLNLVVIVAMIWNLKFIVKYWEIGNFSKIFIIPYLTASKCKQNQPNILQGKFFMITFSKVVLLNWEKFSLNTLFHFFFKVINCPIHKWHI